MKTHKIAVIAGDGIGNASDVYRDAHDAIIHTTATVLVEGPHIPDLGGTANTTDVGSAIAEALNS
jgi:tartrate dehydrogenase/decarboxylase/D-malate dehydrogenase